MYIRVKAIPNAKKEYVKKISDEKLEIAVREPAERNLANSRIMELVAFYYEVPVRQIRFVSGQRSVNKIFSIAKNK